MESSKKQSVNDASFDDTDKEEINNKKGLQLSDPPIEHRKQKKILFYFVLLFTIIWSFAILVLLYCNSFGFWGCSLSDSVMCTLITTTFGTIIGLSLIVSKHFFPKDK